MGGGVWVAAGEYTDNSLDVVVMCNVMHEISPSEWPGLFGKHSLIGRALSSDGFLLLVEDQRIPVGELAHQQGFFVLDTSHLRTMFRVMPEQDLAGQFAVSDARNDGRLKAHWVSKPLLSNTDRNSVDDAIGQLGDTARSEVKRIRESKDKSYASGLLHGFWTQQLANATIFLS